MVVFNMSLGISRLYYRSRKLLFLKVYWKMLIAVSHKASVKNGIG